MFIQALALIILAWCFTLLAVVTAGCSQVYRYYRKARPTSIVESRPLHDVPRITIIRPLRGLEPCLYECLASTFRQTYPWEKLTIHFCVSSKDDPAIPIVQQVLRDFSHFDARLFIEEDDELLQTNPDRYGPNPKIRNMSRSYREAKGDLMWILDCNVWVARGVAGRMVDAIEGLRVHGHGTKYKLVHHLPVAIDVTDVTDGSAGRSPDDEHLQVASTSTSATTIVQPASKSNNSKLTHVSSYYGGRLEEMYLATSHAKMYMGINTLKASPCILGKSNMFRRSHLNALTRDTSDSRPDGIDYFSFNICEDHLIGDILWKHKVPEEVETGARFGTHGMVYGDLAVQPMADMSVKEYIARRVRWQRVRKFTVPKATVTEPGTESFLASVYVAFCLTASYGVHAISGIPQTWHTFGLIWLLCMCAWIPVDWVTFNLIHSMGSIDQDQDTPSFVRPRSQMRRPFRQWLLTWFGRELLALPIWFIAVFGGVTVTWRGKRFKVGMDMRVHPVEDKFSGRTTSILNGGLNDSKALDKSKVRRE